jgi:BrxA
VREVTTPHTGLLRLGLALQQSLAFWRKATTDLPTKELVQEAYQQKWFGQVTEARNRYLVAHLAKRFPYAIRRSLNLKASSDMQRNQLVCHWHLQLTDPLYRSYTGEFLLSCWSNPTTSVTLDESAHWVKNQPLSQDWKAVTIRRLASGLLSAATDAGLCQGSGKTERELRLPNVTEDDLNYLQRLLKASECQTPLPYHLSVGRSEESTT